MKKCRKIYKYNINNINNNNKKKTYGINLLIIITIRNIICFNDNINKKKNIQRIKNMHNNYSKKI